MNRLRIAVAGAGTIGRAHIDALQGSPSCVLSAIVDPGLRQRRSPITPTLDEGERRVAAAEAAHAKLLIGHHRAHSPIMAKAREVVGSGVLGRLVAVSGSATFYKPDSYFNEAPWRREIGGGPILINMIHEVHNLRILCGEIVAVQAFASNATRAFAVEDTVAINLRFAIRGEAVPLVGARDGLANLRVTQAIASAAKSGAIVELLESR